jgi:hypothetical protein
MNKLIITLAMMALSQAAMGEEKNTLEQAVFIVVPLVFISVFAIAMFGYVASRNVCQCPEKQAAIERENEFLQILMRLLYGTEQGA